MLSFEELYISYSPEVYRFARWLVGNETEAEDITSETFVRAWMNFDAIRTETLKAYLFTIARNIHLESVRKHPEHAKLDEQILDRLPAMERKLEHQSELDLVRSMLQAMAEVDRIAFLLRVQHDLPYAEIARVLQLSESSVKVKIHRVRKRLLQARIKKEPQ